VKDRLKSLSFYLGLRSSFSKSSYISGISSTEANSRRWWRTGEVEVGLHGQDGVDVRPVLRPPRHRFHDHEILSGRDAQPQPLHFNHRRALHRFSLEGQTTQQYVDPDAALAVPEQEHARTHSGHQPILRGRCERAAPTDVIRENNRADVLGKARPAANRRCNAADDGPGNTFARQPTHDGFQRGC
jgi:hypothetical protein